MSSFMFTMPLRLRPSWTFLTRHAQVLLCIAGDPGMRLRDIGDQVGITERAAHRIVGELVADGYLSRERQGRRNHYTLRPQLPLPDPRGARSEGGRPARGAHEPPDIAGMTSLP